MRNSCRHTPIQSHTAKMAARSLVYVCLLCLLGIVSGQDESCPATYEYKCGSVCPLNCENFNNPPACIELCQYGCFCPSGKVEHNGTCITPDQCPQCPDSYEYRECGSQCTLTCANYESPPACITVCESGCFCPNATVEYNERCISVQDCPATTPASCPDGYEYKECGSPCAKTCENYQNPPFCASVCEPGCFCPEGMVKHGETCISTDECPTTPQSCPETYEYMECGSPCTKTCDNYDEVSICAAVCQSGCFCPEGTVEHKDRCMSVEQCPRDCNGGKEWQECGTACPLTCDNYKNLLVCTLQCVQGCFCPREKVDLNGVCVNKTTCAGCSYCQAGQTCVAVLGESFEYAMCKDPIAVPCSGESDLSACAPGYRCVAHNTTGSRHCLQSCYLHNGGCSDDQVCYYERRDGDCNPLLEPCYKTSCTDLSSNPGSCPVGWELNQCGSLCQRSCEDYVAGTHLACPEICGPPDCVCPRGMVVFRDRCVDPLECYSLLTNEPDLNPLPVPSDSVLLLVTLVDVEREEVDGARFAQEVEALVKQLGFDDVSVSLFATLETEDGSVVIVLRFEGDSLDRESSSDRLVEIMMGNPGELNHKVSSAQSVGEKQRTESPESSDSSSLLSRGAVAGASVAGVISILAIAVAIAAIAFLILRNKTLPKKSKANEVGLEKTSYGKLPDKEELA